MVREAQVKPLTSVVPVGNPIVSPVEPRPARRKAKLVDEVHDRQAYDNTVEQLSLDTTLDTTSDATSATTLEAPDDRSLAVTSTIADAAMPPATSRRKATKPTATARTTARTTAGSTARSAARSTARSTSTVTKAKRQNTSVSFTVVPDPAHNPPQDSIRATNPEGASPAEPAAFDRIEQEIASLQARLDHLQRNDSAPLQPAGSARAKGDRPHVDRPHPSPRLPDWCEPELRPHYTLREAQQAYTALETSESKRTMQSAAREELQVANQVAQQIRRRPGRSLDLPSAWSTPTQLTPTQSTSTRSQPRSSRRSRPRAKLVWNAPQCGQNLCRVINQWVDRRVPIPASPGAKVVDATIWIVAAIGGRLLLKGLILLIPVLSLPLNILMAIPAIVAAYLAFCVEQSRSAVIYRLLLITVGLFIGSRL
jgi:hypothetical protein